MLTGILFTDSCERFSYPPLQPPLHNTPATTAASQYARHNSSFTILPSHQRLSQDNSLNSDSLNSSSANSSSANSDATKSSLNVASLHEIGQFQSFPAATQQKRLKMLRRCTNKADAER